MKLSKSFVLILSYFVFTTPLIIYCCLFVEPLFIIPVYSLASISFSFCVLKRTSSYIVRYFDNERKLLYNILEDINAMIVVWSDDLCVYNVNDSFLEKTGYTEKELKNLSRFKRIFFCCDENEVFECNNYLDSRQSKLKCSNSCDLTVLWKTTVIQDGKSRIFLSIGIDLTELTNIQDELSASQERFELSMELSEIGLLLRNINSDKFYISANMLKLLGFSSQVISENELEKIIHPNDITIYHSYLNNMHMRAMDTVQNIYSIEMRLLCADGGYHWFCYRFKLSDTGGNKPPMIGGCFIDITNDKEKDNLIEKMAYIDEVTQIFNRNRFMILGQETYLCSKELGISYWLIILDVDKFHIINDTCGYHNGNRLLKEIAITIIKNLSDGGFCARVGGDNFAILIKDTGNDKYPEEIIKSIQKSLSELSSEIFANQTISVSSGYCILPSDGDDFSEVLEHAEFALRMGELPRSNIVRYDDSVHNRILQRSTLEKELEKAIVNNELKLFYQPKINLSNNSIIGVEALIRWIKPDGTIVPPCEFIPVAENSMLITRISEFVINEACRQNKQWQDEGISNFGVSVNLSSVDFYQTDVCATIKNAISNTNLNPKYLEIELTESLALKDVDHAIKQMAELKDIGIKFSMDDFGTGYSSLSYIQVLPITLLKLDRSFIMNLETDDISRQIVTSVINICKSKKIEIIAEGIETSQQADILRTSGCDHAQGYFFGRPMPADALEHFLLKKAN